MAFNTGNPIGSTSPKDLSDNARNLDLLLLGDDPSYPDRKGVPRKSWKGMEHEHATDQARRESEFDTDQDRRESEYAGDKMERDAEFEHDQAEKVTEFDAAQNTRVIQFNTFMDASGYEPPTPYAAGILLDRATKTVTYLGNEYRARGSFIPFTTSNWSTDESKLKLIGDDSLSQKLADPISPENGSSKLGRGVVAIATIADLMAIPAAARRSDLRYLNAEYAVGTGLGGGQWFWDFSDCSALVASDPLRGLYAAPLDAPTGVNGAFRRIFTGDMDASWFGVVYGKTVDALPGLTAAAVLVKQGLNLMASGDILLSGTWNLLGLSADTLSLITILGIVYAAEGDFTPVKISGQRYKFRTLGMTRLGGARTGRPMEIRSTFGAEISLGFVDKFDQGALAVGERGHYGINGIGWLKFEASALNVAGVCFSATTELNGWFNENKIEIASFYGVDGIRFIKGVGQTSRFDGNKIIKPGYEQISGTCQDLEFSTRTTTEDWRIESATGTFAFSEDQECSRNVYRGSWAVVDTKLRLNGILSRLEAQIIDANGATRAVSAQQGADGEWSYESVAAGASTAFPNSIDLRVKPPGVGLPMRLNVKDPNGNAGYIEVKKDRTDQIIPHGTPSAAVLPGTTLVMVSLGSGGSPLTLTMDLGLEYPGCAILLNVSFYNSLNSLTIKKSTGTTTAGTGVISAGLYSLVYVSDVWRISRIGEPYSA